MGTCWLDIESTVAWIWLNGMLGSKIITFGPKSGWLGDANAGCIGKAAIINASMAVNENVLNKYLFILSPLTVVWITNNFVRELIAYMIFGFTNAEHLLIESHAN